MDPSETAPERTNFNSRETHAADACSTTPGARVLGMQPG